MNNNQNPNFRPNRPPSQPRQASSPNGQRPMPRPTGNGRPTQRPTAPRPMPPRREPPHTNVPRYVPKKKKTIDDYLIWFLILSVIILVAVVVVFIIVSAADALANDPLESPNDSSIQAGVNNPNDNTTTVHDWAVVPSNQKAFIPKFTQSSKALSSSELHSEAAIMIDLKTGEVICSLHSEKKIFPASLTKVMTAIVACENIQNMTDTGTLTKKMVNPLVNEGASRARFALDTPIPMKDLVYGVVLPSGADACVVLAQKLFGSEEAFVEKMNEKAVNMGCTGTHFVNPTGLHDDNHYSTVKDIATMLAYAMNNPFIRKVLSATEFDTAVPDEVGENLILYCLWRSTLSGNEATNAKLFAAKTGYTPEAGNCLASVSKTADGKEYAIVTVGARPTFEGESSKPKPFKDAKYLCEEYLPE